MLSLSFERSCITLSFFEKYIFCLNLGLINNKLYFLMHLVNNENWPYVSKSWSQGEENDNSKCTEQHFGSSWNIFILIPKRYPTAWCLWCFSKYMNWNYLSRRLNDKYRISWRACLANINNSEKCMMLLQKH